MDRANQGDSKGAIEELQSLESEMPGDPRIALSLGFLYQSTDQNDLAISELEKAVGLNPSWEAYYALGLLYEAKMVEGNSDSWMPKAEVAWQDFLKLAPHDHLRRATGEKHLKSLRNQGS